MRPAAASPDPLDRALEIRADRDVAAVLRTVAALVTALAARLSRAPLQGETGAAGHANATGDQQTMLDLIANRAVVDAFSSSPDIAAIVSEEMDELHLLACDEGARLILSVDPIDGSGNTDVNGSLGTIFGLYRRSRSGCRALVEDLLAAPLVASGYALYGPATMLVLALDRVDEYTLDPQTGAFLLTRPALRCPEEGRFLTADPSHREEWAPAWRRALDRLLAREDGRRRSVRNAGALVADLHRILVHGGVYLLPPDEGHPEGKLRLLYEALPLARLAELAGGVASTGTSPVGEVRRTALHQQTAFVAGSRSDIALVGREMAAGE